MYLSVQRKKLADVQYPVSANYPRDCSPEGQYGRGRLEFVRSGTRVNRRRSCTTSEHFVHVAYLDSGVYAHTHRHALLKNIMADIQFATALDDYCHGKHE
jgi:hypothetical protein